MMLTVSGMGWVLSGKMPLILPFRIITVWRGMPGIWLASISVTPVTA
jgi:hypothetical protein